MLPGPETEDPELRRLGVAWRRHLTDTDEEVIAAAGYGRNIELGSSPALILVDFQYSYVGDDVPILEQLEDWPSAGGSAAWSAVRNTLSLLESARASRIPIVFSRIGYPSSASASNSFTLKRGNGAGFELGTRGTDIVEELSPKGDEYLLTKTAASVFYGTNLDELLALHSVDTLVVAGLSTSGCVRATVVDGAARGYRVAVAADCAADRILSSHEVALFDVWLKYGSVRSSTSLTHYLADHGAVARPNTSSDTPTWEAP